MFLLSPLVLIPLSLTLRKPYGFRKSMVLLFMLNTSSTFMPMAHKLLVPGYQKWVLVTIILNICQTGEVSRKCFFSDYDTQSKLIDYFIGMTLAVIMREDIEKPFLYMVKERHRAVSTVSHTIFDLLKVWRILTTYLQIINFLIWTLILFGMLSIVICYQLVETYNEDWLKSVFASIMRPVWCTGLSWIVYSCHHGYGGKYIWAQSYKKIRNVKKSWCSTYSRVF